MRLVRLLFLTLVVSSNNSVVLIHAKQEEYESKGTKQFRHFEAHLDNMTCTGDEHSTPFNNQVRGVNLGGWMVLEPWITPSMFYQFLSSTEKDAATDTYHFCKVLGAKEANTQLRRHWDTWVTEDIIRQLAESGAVNSLRLPVGDYQFKPYGPYLDGCFDGSLDYVEQLLDWAHEFGLSVLIDIHTIKGSQNGFDNSGQSMGFQWTSSLTSEFGGLDTFEHWPIRTAEWMGKFDFQNLSYPDINYDNIQHALEVIEAVVDRFSGHPAVLGLEPVNEPWQYTPIEALKRFYWEGYLIMKAKAPYWKYVIHDSFRFDTNIWGGFMNGCPDRALDTHIYQAWNEPASRISFYTNACSQKRAIFAMEQAFGPVIVGEWSLATDNCAMWLNGFNDNLPGFPRLPCKYIPCSDPYMGEEQPGTPPDPSKALQGPYGTGLSGPIYGQCPVNRDWIKESSGNPTTGVDWVRAPPLAPPRRDDSDNVMVRLAYKKINAFSNIGHGFYFWNFRTDLYDPHWSYMAALERGWIPSGDLNDDRITNACHKEDTGEFNCVVLPGALDENLQNALAYCLTAEDKKNVSWVFDLKGKELVDKCNDVFQDFWSRYRISKGATCDFGGVATLVELNRTITDDEEDWPEFDDDSYIVYVKPNIWLVAVVIVVASMLGGCIGFVAAMRYNKGFNRRVRESTIFRRIPASNSRIFRKSLNLDDYMAIPDLNEGDLAELRRE